MATTESHVRVRRIFPEEIILKVNKDNPKNSELTVEFALDATLSEDGKSSKLMLKADLHHENHEGPFALTIVLVSEFEMVGDAIMPWDDFNKVNGPAIMFPYLRELVTNLTARIGRPVLLPTMNIAAAIRQSLPAKSELPPKV